MKMSFWAGALAGFLLGSTKQGCDMRSNLEGMVNGLFGREEEKASEDSKPSEKAQTFEPGGLDFAKANEMAEKLNAKVSEPVGEESLPHGHHLHIPTNRLSA